MVALSTTEAEYIAAVEASKEILWMHQFMGELGYSPSSSSTLLMDNQSVISVSKNPVYVPTEDMAADILTKSLMRPYVEKCRKLMGLT